MAIHHTLHLLLGRRDRRQKLLELIVRDGIDMTRGRAVVVESHVHAY